MNTEVKILSEQRIARTSSILIGTVETTVWGKSFRPLELPTLLKEFLKEFGISKDWGVDEFTEQTHNRDFLPKEDGVYILKILCSIVGFVEIQEPKLHKRFFVIEDAFFQKATIRILADTQEALVLPKEN